MAAQLRRVTGSAQCQDRFVQLTSDLGERPGVELDASDHAPKAADF